MRYVVSSMNPPESLGEYDARVRAEARYEEAVASNPGRPVQLRDREKDEVLLKNFGAE